MAEPVILSLGSVNADFQVRTRDAPDLGRTVMATDFVRLSGGKAANRAFLARRLGHPAWLLARVGADDLREQVLGPLRDAGVDLSGVSMADRIATAVSMIAVMPDGKKTIVLAANANDAWDDTPAAAVAARIDPASDRYDIEGVSGPNEYHVQALGAARPGLRGARSVAGDRTRGAAGADRARSCGAGRVGAGEPPAAAPVPR
ncbi:MAG TPA: PfkB family carbohydrate kinase [Acetobacteraceae bacterium]|nr:PfkB family carbohydrate kinase [Acetobacteraceae bacterium]